MALPGVGEVSRLVHPSVVLTRLQRLLRTSELAFVALAIGIGSAGGLLTIACGAIARTIQHWLFALPSDERLSSADNLSWLSLLALPLGGAVLAAFTWATRARHRPLIDAVEANALHGGRMGIPDSLIVIGQTVISNGFGASVGLEAAYAQAGAVASSATGTWMRLRRGDLRILVGAGTAGAIAAAFGAPLAGAFYAFEIVIGAYTVAAIAPVAAAALAGALVAQLLGVQPYLIAAGSGYAIEPHHYMIYGLLGAICALLAIALMRAVTLVEMLTRRWIRPDWLRPVMGGAVLIPLACLTPQALSAGHGALHADIDPAVTVQFLLVILAIKSVASVVSLGFGFRGGLFFASLFIGTLIGHLFAHGLNAGTDILTLDPRNSALVGMAAFSAAVIGAPMTMAMLVLQATQNFALTGAVIAASLVASTLVRELFGFSFSTWRLHLRGETVKSARDVGWIRGLLANDLMRRETRQTPAMLSIAEFRGRFPLGATSRVVLADTDGRYAGIVDPAIAFAEGLDTASPVGNLARAADRWLLPTMNILEVIHGFDEYGDDELAVVDADRKVLGLVTETYARRRYAEEVDKAQRALFGES